MELCTLLEGLLLPEGGRSATGTAIVTQLLVQSREKIGPVLNYRRDSIILINATRLVGPMQSIHNSIIISSTPTHQISLLALTKMFPPVHDSE